MFDNVQEGENVESEERKWKSHRAPTCIAGRKARLSLDNLILITSASW